VRILDLLLHKLFPRKLAGKEKGAPFESEDEAFEFGEQVYRETGGATPELRRAYDFHRKNFDAGRSSGTRYRDVAIRFLSETSGFFHFACGVYEIDEWCRAEAADRDRRNKARVFCATIAADNDVCGFYSLSLRRSDSKHIAADRVRDYNKSGFVPFIYIDHLAVQRELQGCRPGSLLLMDALLRCRAMIRNIGCAGVARNSLTPPATT